MKNMYRSEMSSHDGVAIKYTTSRAYRVELMGDTLPLASIRAPLGVASHSTM